MKNKGPIEKKPLAIQTRMGRRLVQERAIVRKELEEAEREAELIAAEAEADLEKRVAKAREALERLISASDSPYDDSLLNYDIINASVIVEAFSKTGGKDHPPVIKKLEKDFIEKADSAAEYEAAHRKHLDVLYG
jgi:hypothetical protein